MEAHLSLQLGDAYVGSQRLQLNETVAQGASSSR